MALTLANIAILWVTRLTPSALIVFIPIVEIEARVLRRRTGIALRAARWRVAIANMVTTILGFPLLWCMMLVADGLIRMSMPPGPVRRAISNALNAVPIGLGHYPDDAGVSTAWFLASLAAFLIIACALSIVIERGLLGIMLRRSDVASRALWNACIVGNLLSYALLMVVAPAAVHLPIGLAPDWLLELVNRIASAAGSS